MHGLQSIPNDIFPGGVSIGSQVEEINDYYFNSGMDQPPFELLMLFQSCNIGHIQ